MDCGNALKRAEDPKLTDEWIDKEERMPRENECGSNGRIVVWHQFNGAMITNRNQLAENHFMKWWMPYPKPPEGAEKLLSALNAPKVKQ